MESDIGKHVQADIHPVKPPLYTKISCRGLGKSLLQQWKNMVHFILKKTTGLQWLVKLEDVTEALLSHTVFVICFGKGKTFGIIIVIISIITATFPF